MDDIQKTNMSIYEAIAQMDAERIASATNLTIGKMTIKLNDFDDNETITLSNGLYFDGTYGSYRGYYDDLYFGFDSVDKGFNTVGKLKGIIKVALEDGEMYGYKGGEFSINDDTLVWFSLYGRTGDMIVDIQMANDKVYVITKEDEY